MSFTSTKKVSATSAVELQAKLNDWLSIMTTALAASEDYSAAHATQYSRTSGMTTPAFSAEVTISANPQRFE